MVIKIQPTHVDYFHSRLQPWKHYIPVRADLSDLFAKADWALSDSNSEPVQRIIHNANRWCYHQMRMETLASDMVQIWDVYAGHFEKDTLWAPTELLNTYNFTLVAD